MKETVQMLGERRLARPVRTEYGYKVSLLYFKIDFIYGPGKSFHLSVLVTAYVFKCEFLCAYKVHDCDKREPHQRLPYDLNVCIKVSQTSSITTSIAASPLRGPTLTIRV